ncbi:hypothetical protein [Pedobacter endophyticus]|uniref:Uncharacterized protein n=1 Tax=Pedobacter endophyticus TaxID=2789740 RepID=A0A7U3Q5I0_9SPHI|nr:hypothetical protein [Pedobacter endophyticus]QPH38060.1 hypothetical protein IZT61_13225 [Pedobacter endophyticus]
METEPPTIHKQRYECKWGGARFCANRQGILHYVQNDKLPNNPGILNITKDLQAMKPNRQPCTSQKNECKRSGARFSANRLEILHYVQNDKLPNNPVILSVTKDPQAMETEPQTMHKPKK